MKKLYLYIFIVLLVLTFTSGGCQYLIPPVVQAGSLSIKKDVEKTTPQQLVSPDVYEVEVIPPNQEPSSEPSWYLPETGKREK